MVGMIRKLVAWLLGRPVEPRPDPGPTTLDMIGPPGWEPPAEDVTPRVVCKRCGLIQAPTAFCIRCEDEPLPYPFDAVRDRILTDGDRMITEEEVTKAEPMEALARPEDDLIVMGKVTTSVFCPRCKRGKQLHGDFLVAEELTCSHCGFVFVNARAPRPEAPVHERVWDQQIAAVRAAAMIMSLRLTPEEEARRAASLRGLPGAPAAQAPPEEDEDWDDDLDDDEEDWDDDDDDDDDDEDDDLLEEEEPFHPPSGVAESFPRLVGWSAPLDISRPINPVMGPKFPGVPKWGLGRPDV